MKSKTKLALRTARQASTAEQLRSWMHQTLYDLPPASAVLALGCEQAFLAQHLAEYATEVSVLDSSADQVAQLAPRFPEIAFHPHSPGAPLPLARESVDAIWCCEYLDRVFDPVSALREMHRVLVPGGRLVVTVPDHGAVRKVLIALFKWEEHFAPTNPRIRHFNRSTLARVTHDAGFGHVTTATAGGRRIAGKLVPRGLMLRASKASILRVAGAGARKPVRRAEADFDGELAYATRTRAA